MAVLATCDGCGKKIKLDDKRVGTTVNCPACRTQFHVQPVGSGRTVRVRTKAVDTGKPVKIAINWLPILTILGALIVVGFIAMVYFGPVRTKHQWDDMVGTAQDTITDVVQRGLAHQKEKEMAAFDPELLKKMRSPSVYNVHCFWKGWVLSMPEYVAFKGTSSEGEFSGRYYTQTGEVESSADMGGLVIASLAAAKRGNETLKITGRRKGGALFVEVNGTKVP
jgi:hypothetical protein